MDSATVERGDWPDLNWTEWEKTADTLHMWTQIVGKTRLALSPLQAQWWNVPLYVSARGLCTSAMPYGRELLEVEFVFFSHDLRFRTSWGATMTTPLREQSVANFYVEYQRSLAALGVSVSIFPVPVEVKNPKPFAEDNEHASYEPEYAHRFWRVLVNADRIFQQFSTGFVGKISPVHFFWGSFDLAVTRFSGRPAPVREGTDNITREAYSQEVISAGFWPGNGSFGEAAFYCYAAPVPDGLLAEPVLPKEAEWNVALGEFILKYSNLRTQSDPDTYLRTFLQSSYEAGAKSARWNRAALERLPEPERKVVADSNRL